MTSLPCFKMAEHRDLRCGFHSQAPTGAGYKTRLESRIKKVNPHFIFMIDSAGHMDDTGAETEPGMTHYHDTVSRHSITTQYHDTPSRHTITAHIPCAIHGLGLCRSI